MRPESRQIGSAASWFSKRKIRLKDYCCVLRSAIPKEGRFILGQAYALQRQGTDYAAELPFTSINPSARSFSRRPIKSRAQRSGSTSYSPVIVF
jgi:hypothetical protein